MLYLFCKFVPPLLIPAMGLNNFFGYKCRPLDTGSQRKVIKYYFVVFFMVCLHIKTSAALSIYLIKVC